MVCLYMKTLDYSYVNLCVGKYFLSSSCTYAFGLHYVIKAPNAIKIMVLRCFLYEMLFS